MVRISHNFIRRFPLLEDSFAKQKNLVPLQIFQRLKMSTNANHESSDRSYKKVSSNGGLIFGAILGFTLSRIGRAYSIASDARKFAELAAEIIMNDLDENKLLNDDDAIRLENQLKELLNPIILKESMAQRKVKLQAISTALTNTFRAVNELCDEEIALLDKVIDLGYSLMRIIYEIKSNPKDLTQDQQDLFSQTMEKAKSNQRSLREMRNERKQNIKISKELLNKIEKSLTELLTQEIQKIDEHRKN